MIVSRILTNRVVAVGALYGGVFGATDLWRTHVSYALAERLVDLLLLGSVSFVPLLSGYLLVREEARRSGAPVSTLFVVLGPVIGVGVAVAALCLTLVLPYRGGVTFRQVLLEDLDHVVLTVATWASLLAIGGGFLARRATNRRPPPGAAEA